MIRLAFATAGLMLALGTGSAFAQAACFMPGPAIDMRSGFGDRDWRFGEREQNELDRQRLRQVGVLAQSTERWGGCIRAWISQPGGGMSMELYNPQTLMRVF
jgi:hypothetical protein